MGRTSPRIGVLAVQGAFSLHRRHLEAAGAEYLEVVGPQEALGLDGLILPGGESGAMLRHIDRLGLEGALLGLIAKKRVWGICAGAILLAKTVRNPPQRSFGALDASIERNAYGRQLDSVEEEVDGYRVSYIRAPRITEVGAGVDVLATHEGFPCWVEAGRVTLTTFHPELNLDTPSPWHRRFVHAAGQ